MYRVHVLKEDNSIGETLQVNILEDDTINTIKLKIIQAMGGRIPMDDLYLFSQIQRMVSPKELYSALTNKEKEELSRVRLQMFLSNIVTSKPLDLQEGIEYFSFNELTEIPGLNWDQPMLMRAPLGQHFMVPEFTANPLDFLNMDLTEKVTSAVNTTNGNLLMLEPFFQTMERELYVVVADVIAAQYPEVEILRPLFAIYYPFLNKEGIFTREKLLTTREKRLAQTKKMLSERWETSVANVAFLTDLASYLPDTARKGTSQQEFMYLTKTLFQIHPTFSFNMPLEQLFRILHSNAERPLIKHNPGLRKQKIYRLFAPDQSKDGRLIPALPKGTIFKASRTLGMMTSLAVHYEHSDFDLLTLTAGQNGSLTIQTESNKKGGMEMTDLEVLLKTYLNPLISEINAYLQQSGLSVPLFEGFLHERVEILSMEAEQSFVLTKKPILKIKDIQECVQPVFNVIQDDLKKGVIMRYKRVANYNEFSAREAVIIELIRRNKGKAEIIEFLEANFAMTSTEAQDAFTKFLGEVQVEESLFENKKFRIKENPGFAVVIQLDPIQNEMNVRIEGIDSTQYFKPVSRFIGALMWLAQGLTNTYDLENPLPKELSDHADTHCKKRGRGRAAREQTIEEVIQAPIGTSGLTEGEDLEERVEELVFGEDDDGDDDLLDMLMGDDEDEDEDEGEGAGADEGGADEGGADDEPLPMADITGLALSNPNYFFARMEQRDPKLFLKKQQGKFNAYSRMCPSNINRQPVILTNEEKARIDATHPGSYSNAIEYGSSPDKKHWYICPRYWCIPENTSLSKQEVEEGACGGPNAIIPYGSKKVPAGKTIFSFAPAASDTRNYAHKEYYDKEGNFIEHHPGFIPGDKHPDGLCMPCCFKTWDNAEQVRRREECAQQLSDMAAPGKDAGPATEGAPDKAKTTTKAKAKTKAKSKAHVQSDYIIAPEKFPLDATRWGYLPPILQSFLGQSADVCQSAQSEAHIKSGASCLLRHGVEPTPTHSFIACLADVFVDYLPDKKIPSVKQMMNYIAGACSLDLFVGLQNGNLVALFFGEDINAESTKGIDYYNKSLLYQNTDMANEAQVAYLEKAVVAYEHFITYLKDPASIVNYEYLWDLVCIPNPKLFTAGLNLLILNLPEEDITGNVEIICPTNHYASSFYNPEYQTLVLMKKENYMEPIYIYQNLPDKKAVIKTISVKTMLSEEGLLRPIINKLGELLDGFCRPMPSLPNVYTFKKSIELPMLLRELRMLDTKPTALVVNYNGKTIGVQVAMKSGEAGILPCQPTGLGFEGAQAATSGLSVPRVYADSPDLYTTYEATKAFLDGVNKSSKKIPSKVAFKIIEDGLVVGVLTQSNQFVLTTPPAPPEDDDVPTQKGTNFMESDRILLTNKDKPRDEYVQQIYLEKEFFVMYRNLVRIMLNKLENSVPRSELLAVINMNESELPYLEKIGALADIIEELVGEYVAFKDYTPDELNSIEKGTIGMCATAVSCEHVYCKKHRVNGEDICQFLIPAKNLMTGKDNSFVYKSRVADELIRYENIRLFLLDPNVFLQFGRVDYRVRDDEVILMQEMLTQDYFDNLVVDVPNPFVKSNTFDTGLPSESVPYTEKIDEGQIVLLEQESSSKTEEAVPEQAPEQAPEPAPEQALEPAPQTTSCIKKIMSMARPGNAKLKKFFDKDINEIFYEATIPCSYQPCIRILKTLGVNINVQELKQVLIEAYTNLIEKRGVSQAQILRMWTLEGKKKMSKAIEMGEVDLPTLIISDNYYLTLLDYLLVFENFGNFPVVFLSGTFLVENNKPALLVSPLDLTKLPVKTAFIKFGGARANVPTSVSLFSYAENVDEEARTGNDGFLLEVSEVKMANMYKLLSNPSLNLTHVPITELLQNEGN